MLLLDLHTGFSRSRSGGLVFPSLSEFSTVYCDPHSRRLWCSQLSRNRCFSGTLLLFQWPSGYWKFDLWLLSFLKPAWISGSSQFTYCWSLAWRILSITLLACWMSAIVQYFEHSLALPFFGIGMKTDLSGPMATAKILKFADILSAALSQHHLSGFEIAQLEFHHLH